MSRNDSPAKKLRWANFTPDSTRPLSCGDRTLAGSTAMPRACAYSSHSRFHRGSSRSAASTTGLRLSGIENREHAAEELPRRLAARDHRLRRLRERQVHVAVPGEHRREHQRVQLPPPLPVG